jgi:Histidine kinase-, DNA gyrase B-, and HSP90-like ATPase
MTNIDDYFTSHNLIATPQTADTTDSSNEAIPFSPHWAADAPKGGRQVLNRALKESAAVPLFLAQTFIQSLRDVGYESTTSAICEHIDNGIGAEATEIRVYIRQIGKKGELKTDVLVYDNGFGMAPNVLKVATSFGGSMVFNNRDGIGRFGMGMKTAGLSMAPAMEIMSWQEKGSVYRTILDTDAIGRDKSNALNVGEPEYLETLNADVAGILTTPMSFPRDSSEQNLLAPHGVNLKDVLGASGTIVYMPECDRLTSATAKTLVEDATKTFGHVYRRKIDKGLKIFVNNRLVEAADPTFSLPTARHTRHPALEDVAAKTSRLVTTRTIPFHSSVGSLGSYNVQIKIFALPIREWQFPRKTLAELGVFNDQNISILRNDREVFAGHISKIARRHSTAAWYRIEIDFPGELDEAFGVAANKQGVRMKPFVIDAFKKAIGEDLATIKADIEEVQAKRAAEKKEKGPSLSEMKASEADVFQSEQLDARLTDDQKAQMEENLRGLAVGLRREAETDEEAFQRIQASRYIIRFHHDKFWPFYDVEHKFGRVILTINTAHPFYAKLYEPLMTHKEENGDDEAVEVHVQENKLTTVLDLVLLSLARTQSVMSQSNEDAAAIFDNFRQTWSNTLKVQLSH